MFHKLFCYNVNLQKECVCVGGGGSELREGEGVSRFGKYIT